jgi:hypothetical protein
MKSTPLLLALLLSCPLAAVAEPGPALYRVFAEQPAAADCIEVDIDLAHGETPEALPGALRYPLRGKEIAEGWSWPEGVSSDPDYFRYKYLPLASESEDRRSYEAEDMVGEPQTMTERWRYDYFLAFANFAAFIDAADDDAALVLALPADADPARLALRAEACLTQPATRESTTFWKATHAKPVDLTLKKRYLVGELKAVHAVALDDGRRLATLQARPIPPAVHKESDHD